jgi:hypothetical protein
VLVELPARLILKIDIQARFSVTAMMHEIDSMTTHVGAPKRLLIENVPRHHSQNLVRWCAKRGIELEYLPPFGPKVVTARIYRNLDAAIVALGPRPTVDACRMIARAMEAAMNMSRDMAAMYDA